jgi:hypothetical protein
MKNELKTPYVILAQSQKEFYRPYYTGDFKFWNCAYITPWKDQIITVIYQHKGPYHKDYLSIRLKVTGVDDWGSSVRCVEVLDEVPLRLKSKYYFSFHFGSMRHTDRNGLWEDIKNYTTWEDIKNYAGAPSMLGG